MITAQEFSALLEKFHYNSLTPEERDILFHSVASGEYEDLLKSDITFSLEQSKSNSLWTKELENRTLSQILSVTRTRQAPIRRLTWMVAAAAILVLAAAGYFVFLAPSKPASAPVASVKRKDIAPGKNGAVLTLADGRQIVLDDAADGKLAIQGNTQVIKENGQITYNNGQRGIVAATAFNTLTTPRGRQFEVTLPDGTMVWLNAASSITYPTAFTGATREVNISGEAYFEVAKNAEKPFHVKVHGVDVAVLGTHFNINSYENEAVIRTTLLEGSVRISSGSRSSTLKPGQEAAVTRTGDAITVTDDVDTDLATAWKNGFTSFKSADIASIMRQVERWYNVDVKFEGKLPARTFTGDIPRNAPLSELFRIFEASRIHYHIEDQQLIITP